MIDERLESIFFQHQFTPNIRSISTGCSSSLPFFTSLGLWSGEGAAVVVGVGVGGSRVGGGVRVAG